MTSKITCPMCEDKSIPNTCYYYGHMPGYVQVTIAPAPVSIWRRILRALRLSR